MTNRQPSSPFRESASTFFAFIATSLFIIGVLIAVGAFMMTSIHLGILGFGSIVMGFLCSLVSRLIKP